MLSGLMEMRRAPFDRYFFSPDEKEDSAFMILDSVLPNFAPLPEEGFSQFDERAEFQHVLVGYPASSTRGSMRERHRIEIMGYLTSAARAQEYANLQADSARQLVVLFKKWKGFGKNRVRVTFPDPYGMSGGAVLQFHEKARRTQSLVGIMTDWRGGAIIASRIENITKRFRGLMHSASAGW